MDEYNSVAAYKIKRLLLELGNISGHGTELVSLYVPPKKPIYDVVNELKDEYGTASNIKSDTTRTHVQDALTRIMQKLKLYKQPPDTGLIIFGGSLPVEGSTKDEEIRTYEIVPPKPVTTYLYRCVSPDTRIVLQNGLQRTIGQLGSSWSRETIRSTRDNGRQITGVRIKGYIQTVAGRRKVYRLTSESGRTIVATEDHPFFTPAGWKHIADIKPGDLVCVYPLDDMDFQKVDLGGNKIVIDEGPIKSAHYPPMDIDVAVKRLKQLALLPLKFDNPKLPIVARILGYMLSESSSCPAARINDGKQRSVYSIDIYAEDASAAEDIRADLMSLGATTRLVGLTASDGNSNAEGRPHNAINIRLVDPAIYMLLMALGAGRGHILGGMPMVPDWLFNAPAEVQREFLAAYMGGDGQAPAISSSDHLVSGRAVFHRPQGMYEEGMEFARDISRLFTNFGIKIDDILTRPMGPSMDDTRAVEFELLFDHTEENILKLCHAVGFRYSERKASVALLLGEYLRIRAFYHSSAGAGITPVSGGGSGSDILGIPNSLNIGGRTTQTCSSGGIITSILRTAPVSEYSDWLATSRVRPDGFLLWENVVSTELVEVDDVRDLTLDGGDHSFFANGFMVHNCDDHFHLDVLRSLLREEELIGILSMDNSEAGYGTISGDRVDVIQVITSGVGGKHRQGGQSARRFERIRENEINDYFHRVAAHATKIFLGDRPIKALIISGPGMTKEDFFKGEYMDYRLQKMTIGEIDTGYAGEEGIRETLTRGQGLLENMRVIQEKKLVEQFITEASKPKGLAVYGLKPVLDSIRDASAQTILISEDLNMKFVKTICKNCGYNREDFVKESDMFSFRTRMSDARCPTCGKDTWNFETQDLVDFLYDRGTAVGSKIEVISSKSEAGVMFMSFGGIGALLRYRR